MAHDSDRTPACSECGSDDSTKLEQKKAAGGFDWYEYECNDCGHLWHT